MLDTDVRHSRTKMATEVHVEMDSNFNHLGRGDILSGWVSGVSGHMVPKGAQNSVGNL